jgi:hypothetical protein
VAVEADRVDRLRRILGDVGVVGELRPALTALDVVLSNYVALTEELRCAAADVGLEVQALTGA